MRCAAAVLALLIASPGLAQTPAAPDDKSVAADALVREGNRLAMAGKYLDAIAKFRAAERVFPRALHDCNIGLAYSYIKNWVNAHYFINRCEKRWTGSNAKPGWVAQTRSTSETELRAGNFALIRLASTPIDAEKRISLFPADRFLADSIWLPFGEYQVTVSKVGFASKTQIISVFNKSEQQVAVTLEAVAPPANPGTPPAIEKPTSPETPTGTATSPQTSSAITTPPETDREERRPGSFVTGVTLLSVGAGLIVGGGIFHALGASAQSDADDAAEVCQYYPGANCVASDPSTFIDGTTESQNSEFNEADRNRKYEDAKSRLQWQRGTAIALYGVGIASAAVGAFFLYRATSGGSSEEPAVSASITPNGAFVRAALRF